MIIWEELDHPAIEDCIENNGMLLDKEGLAIVGNIVQGVQVDEDVPDKFTIKLV
jgi:hypothetical protein